VFELQKRFTLLSLFFCVMITVVAQDHTRKHSLGIYQQFLDYNVQFSENKIFTFDSALSQSVRVAYQRRLSRTWMLNTGLTNGFILNQRLKENFTSKAYAVGADASVVFKFNNGRILKENPIVAPFLSFAYRVDYVHKLSSFGESPWLFHNQYGAGFNVRLIERTHINIQFALDQKLMGDFNSHLQYRLGLTQSLGKWDGRSPNDNRNLDSDGDGIADIIDKCPDKFGIASTNGCPVATSHLKNTIAIDSLSCLLQGQKEVIRKLELEIATVRNQDFLHDTVLITRDINKLNNSKGFTRLDTLYKNVKPQKAKISRIEKEFDAKESSSIADNKNYYVITFSSTVIRSAKAWQSKVKVDFPETIILVQPNGFYRVGIFAAKDKVLAFLMLEKVEKLGYAGWISVE
jgi:hypothetical protein